MTRYWLQFTAWGGGPVNRATGSAEDKFTHSLQDLWGVVAGAGLIVDADAGGDVWSGRYAVNWPTGGLSDSGNFYGSYVARTQQYIYYCHAVKCVSVNNAAVIKANDIYRVSRCANTVAPGSPYVGLGILFTTDGSTTFKFMIINYDSSGAYASGAGTGTSTFTPTTAWIWVVIRVNTTTLATALFVNGTSEATGGATTGAVFDGRMVNPQSGFISGKGSDAGINWRDGFFGACESTVDSDAPPTTTKAIVYQADADGSGTDPNAWSGGGTGGDATNKYRNIDDDNDDAPGSCDYVFPTATSQDQSFGVKDEASGTVEGVRCIFDQDTYTPPTAHTVYAKETTWYSIGAGVNAYVPTMVGACDDANIKPSWYGRHMRLSPAGNAWTTALFNSLMIGLRSAGTTSAYRTGEFYALAVGTGLTRPAKTPAPAAAAVAILGRGYIID